MRRTAQSCSSRLDITPLCKRCNLVTTSWLLTARCGSFKMRTYESFGELFLHLQVFNAYAQKRSLQLSDCKFVCDGNILNGTQTAEEVCNKMLARSPLTHELSMASSMHSAGSIGRWGCHRHDGLTDRRMIRTHCVLQPHRFVQLCSYQFPGPAAVSLSKERSVVAIRHDAGGILQSPLYTFSDA